MASPWSFVSLMMALTMARRVFGNWMAVLSIGGFLFGVRRWNLVIAVYRLQEQHHQLVEAHAEHRRRLFELLGIECSLASQSFADGFLAHAEFLGERGLCLAVPCELAAEIPCDGFRLTHLSCRSFLCSLPCGNSYRT